MNGLIPFKHNSLNLIILFMTNIVLNVCSFLAFFICFAFPLSIFHKNSYPSSNINELPINVAQSFVISIGILQNFSLQFRDNDISFIFLKQYDVIYSFFLIIASSIDRREACMVQQDAAKS